MSSSVASGCGHAHVVGDRRVEQEAVLRHHADRAPAGRGIDVAEVAVADAHLALRRIGEPAQQLGERRLARTRLADDRDVRAGRDVDAHVVQHGRVAAVREPDVRHLHGERAVREMHAVGRFGDVDRHVEHGEHLAPTGDRGLGLVEDLAQLGDGAQQQVDQEHERDDLADVEAPARCRSTRTATTIAGERDGAEEVAEREHRGEVLRGADPSAVRAVDALAQSRPEPVPAARRRG